MKIGKCPNSNHQVIDLDIADVLKLNVIPPLCDMCGIDLKESSSYVGVLDAIMCPDCYQEWCNNAKHHAIDEQMEKENIDRIIERLGSKS